MVSRGFTQRPGIDYTEIFAPVTRKESINTVLAIAAVEDLEAENLDVDTAFLYKMKQHDMQEVHNSDNPLAQGYSVCLSTRNMYRIQ